MCRGLVRGGIYKHRVQLGSVMYTWAVGLLQFITIVLFPHISFLNGSTVRSLIFHFKDFMHLATAD